MIVLGLRVVGVDRRIEYSAMAGFFTASLWVCSGPYSLALGSVCEGFPAHALASISA